MAFPTTLPSYIITAPTDSPFNTAGAGLSPLLNSFETDITAIGVKLGIGASVPSTSGYLLTSTGGGNTAWTAPPVSAVWGLITGTLSDQADLTAALNARVLINGSTMTGLLVLSADPAVALGAATKQYVDNKATSSMVDNEIPGGSINSSNVNFTTASVYATGSLQVYLNGQRLISGGSNDYVEVSSGFTMNYAPLTGDVLLVGYNVTNSAFIQGSNSDVTQESPTGLVNSSNASYTTLQSKYVAGTLEVFINGLQQTRVTDYTETTPGSGVFTMAVAPTTGDILRVSYQFSTGASGNADTVDGYHANDLMPIGAPVPYFGRSAPSGNWLMCYGQAVSRTTYATLFSVIAPTIGVFTVTIASPGVVTLTAHGLNTGEPVYLTTTGALPTGLSANTLYYVIRTGANTFTLATSSANAYSGTAINTTGSQSGTHTTTSCPHGLGDGTTTFNIPDLRGRTVAGWDIMGGTSANRLTLPTASTVGGIDGDVMGGTGGAETHTITTAQLASHTHDVKERGSGTGVFDALYSNTAGWAGSSVAAAARPTGSDTPHNNVQPSVVTNYIVKAL